MKKIFTFTSTLIVCIVAFAHAQELNKFEPSGPLNIRNQMPLYLFYMAPSPDMAQTLKRGKVEVDASYHVANVIVQQSSWPGPKYLPEDGETNGDRNREWWTYIDTEVNRLDLNLSYGLLDNLEASVDIPYYIFSDGYLDSFIEGFEKGFSFIKTPNARAERGKNEYEYEIRNRGNPIIFSTSHPNDWGEIATYLKYKILDEDKWWPTTSVRGGVKFPTTKDKLLGSKKFDYMLGFLIDKTFYERFFLYFNVNYVFLNRPDIYEKLHEFQDHMLHGVLGFEYCFTDQLSMLFQATANTTIYSGGGTSTYRDPVVLTLGFNYNINDKVSWQIAMDENTNTAAPDFGVYTGLKIKL
ncbi:MAG: DUF3187 family protein [Candidatus Omnitrophica bacterium]|nr:DUF3187 family protein [Candidatus Omnitrophota bacterium]